MRDGHLIQFSPVNIANRKKIDVRSGDTIRVWMRIKEGEKTRLQAFEGLVLARKHGSEPGATITIRKIVGGVGVERIFPLYLPTVEKIELVRRSKSRRSKLYYIRDKAAKEVRKKMRQIRMVSRTVFEKAEDKKEEEPSGEVSARG